MTPERRSSGFEAAVWLRIGLLSFGGPAAHIALIQSEIVDRLKWADQRTFLQGLSFVTMLPGPEAQQLGTYLGWHYGGLKSALIAGLGFIVPGAALMIVLSLALVELHDTGLIAHMLAAVRPVVVALIVAALWRLRGVILASPACTALSVVSFAAILTLDLPFPAVLAATAAIALAAPRLFAPAQAHDEPDPPARRRATPGWRHAALIAAAGIAAWLAIAAVTATSFDAGFAAAARLISVAVIVIFGGAYAVIGYVADQAVGALMLLDAQQVANGLALSEAAPGPLILFNTYVGTLAASSGASGLAMAIYGGIIATLLTFLPSFVLVLAGAPYVHRLARFERARAVLAAISAAVIGLIANLAVIIAMSAFSLASQTNWEAIAITAAALGLLVAARAPTPLVILLGLAYGVLRWTLIPL